jgi:hypothetical protein
MIDDCWYRSSSAIAFYVCIALIIILAGIAHSALAQETAPQESDGGFWDMLGNWWNSFADWLLGGANDGGGLGKPLPPPTPIEVTPLVVGWSNTNHTLYADVVSYDYFTNTTCYYVEPNATNDGVNGWQSCDDYREIHTPTPYDVIDDQWQTASNGVTSIDLNRDYYWFVDGDGRVIGDSIDRCDGGLPHKDDIELKAGCDYIVMNITTDEDSQPVILADTQDANQIKTATPISTDTAIDMATMKVAG